MMHLLRSHQVALRFELDVDSCYHAVCLCFVCDECVGPVVTRCCMGVGGRCKS